MVMPAVVYMRVSSTGQENGHGLKRQEHCIRAYAAKAGFKLQRFYQDVYTGTTDALDRLGFGQMVAELNDVRVIIIERLDRLARSMMVQEQTIAWLTAHDIQLMVADTGENVTQAYMDDPMKRALVQMQGVFAELEKSMLVRKLRLARQRMRKQRGKCEGRKAYGELDGSERDLIRLMRPMKDDGMSYAAIARYLNDEGYRTRTNRIWTRNTVRNVLVR